ncbi:MAG: 3-dehydroquinate synthase [Eubacteriales bacterium]|nr:3-dehydroquinate synthase [Eubacteriales bacterium]
MSEKLIVKLGERSYPIYLENSYDDFTHGFSGLGSLSSRAVIITDTNVYEHQYPDFETALKNHSFKAEVFVVEAGEESKNLQNLQRIYKFFMENELDRTSVVIALGGGVVGDLAGYAAATYLRGISFVQVPTTLLSQADSSVGGKVGVDFEGAKNLIGAFYQPKFVYINVNSLRTLPSRELRSGLAETLKHGLIKDPDFLTYINDNMDKLFNYDEEVLKNIAYSNCSIKASVVEQDEKEDDIRATLNLGHTIGHALESVSNFALSHGECVSLGITGAFKLARKLGMISGDYEAAVAGILKNAGLPVSISGMDAEVVYQQMYLDKKVRRGRLNFILPTAPGQVVRREVSDRELVMEILHELFQNQKQAV